MAVARLAPTTDQEFQDDAFTKQFVLDKLTHYSELRRQLDAGETTLTSSRAEITSFLENWLGRLCEIDELFWVAKTEKEKRIMDRRSLAK